MPSTVRQAVVYRGPFSSVTDDDGHTLARGKRTAVCDKTFRVYSREPYASHFDTVEPLVPVDPRTAEPFDCSRDALRAPGETKGADYRETREAEGDCCGPDDCC